MLPSVPPAPRMGCWLALKPLPRQTAGLKFRLKFWGAEVCAKTSQTHGQERRKGRGRDLWARTGCRPWRRGAARGGCSVRLAQAPSRGKPFHDADVETLRAWAAGQGPREGAASLQQQCKGEGAARCPAQGSAAARSSLLMWNRGESPVRVSPACRMPRAFTHQGPGYRGSVQGEETQELVCQEQRRSLREKQKLNLDLCTGSNT